MVYHHSEKAGRQAVRIFSTLCYPKPMHKIDQIYVDIFKSTDVERGFSYSKCNEHTVEI